MPVASATDVRKQIESAQTQPLYLVEGGDVQSRNDLAQEFLAVVEEGLQAFNVEILHAADATSQGARDQLIGSLLAAARTLPMMSPRRLIVVHDAERLLSPKRAQSEEEAAAPESPASTTRRKRAATPMDEFEAYLESPETLTTVVFVAGPLDANRRLVKLLRQHGVAVDSGSLASPADAARWIKNRLERDEMWMEQKAIAALLRATGLDLGRIRSEVEKLVLYAAGETSITETHVKEVVIPQDEAPGENFPMGQALKRADVKLALKEVGAQLDAGAQPVMVLGQIRAATHWMNGPAIKPALDSVFRTDLAIKSSAGDPRHLLERLVIELCAK